MVRPIPRPRQGGNWPWGRVISTKFEPACGKKVLGPEPGLALATLLKTPGYNGGVPFTIRDFRAEDFDALWRIDQDCFPPGIAYSRQELKLYLRRRGAFTLVASMLQADPDAGKTKRVPRPGGPTTESIGGFIVAEAGPRGSGHVITIDVIKAARRSGVGSLLLRAAEDRLLTAGCRNLALETAVDN